MESQSHQGQLIPDKTHYSWSTIIDLNCLPRWVIYLNCLPRWAIYFNCFPRWALYLSCLPRWALYLNCLPKWAIDLNCMPRWAILYLNCLPRWVIDLITIGLDVVNCLPLERSLKRPSPWSTLPEIYNVELNIFLRLPSFWQTSQSPLGWKGCAKVRTRVSG